MSRTEQARFMVLAVTRMSYWMVSFLGIAELACLPVAAHHRLDLLVDLAALATTALFTLSIWLAPRWALRVIDRMSRPAAGRGSRS